MTAEAKSNARYPVLFAIGVAGMTLLGMVVTNQAVKAAATKPLYLTWDSVTASNRVYIGAKVDVWTNSFVVMTNRCLYVAGVVYGVASLRDGQESAIITFPSNRIERLVVEVFESVDGVKIGDYPWVSWTNTISGNSQKFLKLRQELTGWIK